jgi:hypothetical protein
MNQAFGAEISGGASVSDQETTPQRGEVGPDRVVDVRLDDGGTSIANAVLLFGQRSSHSTPSLCATAVDRASYGPPFLSLIALRWGYPERKTSLSCDFWLTADSAVTEIALLS